MSEKSVEQKNLKNNNTNDSCLNSQKNQEISDNLIFTKLIYSKDSFLFHNKFVSKIIEVYLKEFENKSIIIVGNKHRIRKISYLVKYLNNNNEIKLKKSKDKDFHKILAQILICFNRNILAHLLSFKIEKTEENNTKIIYLNKFLKLLLKIIAISYLSNLIDEDLFELIIKNILIFSFEKSKEEKENNLRVLKHIMFFNECMQIIKFVFNKIYSIKKIYSERQKEIIKNIFIHININIIDPLSKDDLNYHSNKSFLQKYDYKTSLLIEFAYIIVRMNSPEITKQFINLLTNIYSFSFQYENCMKPILRLIEPLLLNLDKKNLDAIHNELELSDFTINYINSLNNKENDLLKIDGCMIKEGFFFNNKSSAIHGDIKSHVENDFVILFSFRLQTNDFPNITIFELYNDDKTLVKFTLNKDLQGQYELYFQDDNKETNTRIIIYPKTTYIFCFIFMTEGFFRHKAIKIIYTNENIEQGKKNQQKIISCGQDIKTKNIDNIKKICIGCDRQKNSNIFENKFIGFIGDFIILNAKRIKENLDAKLFEEILELRQNYDDIIQILSDKDTNLYSDVSSNLKNNSTLNKVKSTYENLKNRIEFKSNFSVNTIISPRYFKLIDYEDEFDFTNSFNNFESYLKKLSTPISLKVKYFQYKMKNDSKNERCLNMDSSIFNKEFHIFKRNFSLIEFVKYEGIQYLSLLYEYYYQILCYLIENKSTIEQNKLKEISKKINEKLIIIMNFFTKNIILTDLYEYNIVQIEQCFYQMSKVIFKFVEIDDLEFDTIKCIVEMINALNKKSDIKKPKLFQFLSLMKIHLIEIILNPRIYRENNDSCLEKLYYAFFYLLTILKNIKIDNHEKIYSKENLEMLMSYLWLLDEPKDKKLFEEAKKNFTSLVILFIQMQTAHILIEREETDDDSDDEEELFLNFIKKNPFKKGGKRNFLISDLFNKAIENRKNKNIFFNLSLILVKTNLIWLLKESEINQAEECFKNEIKDGETDNNDESKKTLYLSYLQILVSYYFSETKYRTQNISINSFNDFIYNLNLDMNIFHALISIIEKINQFKQINQIEIQNYELYLPKIINKNEYPKFSILPFKEINIDDLNEIEIYIIKNILLDILYLVEKYEKKYSKIIKEKNTESNNKNSEIIMGKEFFDIIKKNVDIVFKYPKTKIYEIMFSCESNICTQLFELKWKYGYEKDINYIKTALKKYYNELIKTNYCPFIYRLLLEVSNENIFMNDSKFDYSIINKTVTDFKSEMLIFIIGTLLDFSKELKTSNKGFPFYAYNLLNCLIVLNEELNIKPDILFNNNILCEAIYTLISLISEGFLYSNFCIEFKDKRGKIISEIILDIFLSIPSEFFKQNMFLSTFIKNKEKMTIFCVMDNYKEKIIERKKIKNILRLPELAKMKELNSIILSFNPKKRRLNLVDENKIYQIEDVNFSIFFLAKGFLYLRSSYMKEKENANKVKMLSFLVLCLADDVYSLYTRNKLFYSTKTTGFPLYDETKKYFESYIVQNYNFKGSKSSNLYKKFFENDLIVIIKDEYNLDFCYSSRLYKSKINKQSHNQNYEEEKKEKEKEKHEEQDTKSNQNSSENKSDTSSTYMFYPDNSSNSEQKINNEEKVLDSVELKKKESKEIKEVKEKNNKEFTNPFEVITENIVINPRNLFLKNVFSEIYKDITFYNKTFNYIKKIYITKFKDKEGLVYESKQKNYPSRQKNYSNFLEPRIFLKRDFNFFDKIYFPISFEYISNNFLDKKLENVYFYKHKIIFDKNDEKLEITCELVTSQYIYFGKLYIYENYIIFETEEDPRNDADKINDKNIFINYSISTKTQDKYPVNYKFILIFFKDIHEAIQRRTLLLTQSLELFLNNGKSFLFNFYKIENAKKIYDLFDKIKSKFTFHFNINNHKDISNITSEFHKGKISNYDYLLNLNKYGTRTYNDLSQYPVVPWLVLQHDQMDNIEEGSEYLRDMKYPISVQNEEKRNQCIDDYKTELNNMDEDDKNEDREYASHFQVHYSNSAFIFYYLMRLNPYCQGMIKLQNYHNENPNRIFLSFQSLESILNSGADNRELIPDFFCYFDFLINLNCNFFGQVKPTSINDDFDILSNQKQKTKYIFSPYVHNLYREKKLINSLLISKELHEWVDIIFGKRQLLDDDDNDEAAESCNIYKKYCYEQRTNFEKEIELTEKLINSNEIDEKELIKRIKEVKSHISFAVNFGMTPKQILKSTICFEEENKSIFNEFNKNFEDKLLFFEKINNEEYLVLKDINKKVKYKSRNIGLYTFKNKNLIEHKLYECKKMSLMKKYKNITIDFGNKKEKRHLYNPCYSFSYTHLELKSGKKNKFSNLIIFSCRYLGNYFNVQNADKNINVYCEDFVTCIKAKNKESSGIFYTGLYNGKLIEWEINSNFEIKETKHIYSHGSSITALELYDRQNIVVTGSEDKYIHIRKQYDFELLTVINLNYLYPKSDFSQNLNIFPSLIKISDLNLLYVLLYDLDKETSFIRGYNLNGLFFAETEDIENKNVINSISFTKNSNLIIGFFNLNQYYLLQSWDLNVYKQFDINVSKNKEGTKFITYEPSLDIFHLLYDNEFIRTYFSENDKISDF